MRSNFSNRPSKRQTLICLKLQKKKKHREQKHLSATSLPMNDSLPLVKLRIWEVFDTGIPYSNRKTANEKGNQMEIQIVFKFHSNFGADASWWTEVYDSVTPTILLLTCNWPCLCLRKNKANTLQSRAVVKTIRSKDWKTKRLKD